MSVVEHVYQLEYQDRYVMLFRKTTLEDAIDVVYTKCEIEIIFVGADIESNYFNVVGVICSWVYNEDFTVYGLLYYFTDNIIQDMCNIKRSVNYAVYDDRILKSMCCSNYIFKQHGFRLTSEDGGKFVPYKKPKLTDKQKLKLKEKDIITIKSCMVQGVNHLIQGVRLEGPLNKVFSFCKVLVNKRVVKRGEIYEFVYGHMERYGIKTVFTKKELHQVMVDLLKQ